MEGATGPAVAQLLKLPDVEWKASLDSLQGLPAALETDLSLDPAFAGITNKDKFRTPSFQASAARPGIHSQSHRNES
jgi:hypothetical protein